MLEFKLPSLGSDMDEGKLLEWKVRAGDTVKRGQVVAVVDTSKAAVEVEIWTEGMVHELVTQIGETIPVGAVMATVLQPGESAADAKPYVRPGAGSAELKAAPATPAAAVTPLPPSSTPAERPRISPAARKHAEELGVDLATITPSGPHHVISLDDVMQAAAARKAPDRNAAMRAAIAAAMGRSKREIPHYYLWEQVALAKAVAWLQSENARRDVTERLLMAVLFLKAVALACRAFPDMNGFMRGDGYAPSAAVHVGVAISLRQGGLVAPAIHDADQKTLTQLMQELNDLVKRARAGSLRSSEMSDPTITVTNLGDQGVESVVGVIYPPQVTLVGIGRVAEQPWADNGALRVVPAATISLAADHRASDGHRGALFLAAIRDGLQEPEKL